MNGEPPSSGERFYQLFEKVEDTSVRFALMEGVLELPKLDGINVEPESHGYMSSLAIRREDKWCFSLAPAKLWLLLYVRKPELARGKLDLATVREVFSDVSERSDGELTVRLRSVRDVQRLREMIKSTQ
jgi:hypothetical protein